MLKNEKKFKKFFHGNNKRLIPPQKNFYMFLKKASRKYWIEIWLQNSVK